MDASKAICDNFWQCVVTNVSGIQWHSFPNKWIQRRLNLQKRKTNCELLLQDPLKKHTGGIAVRRLGRQVLGFIAIWR